MCTGGRSTSADPVAGLAAGLGVIPLVETLEGNARAAELAAAPGVVRLAFGNLDFQADAGMDCGPDESELVPVRLALVLAARHHAGAFRLEGRMVDAPVLRLAHRVVAAAR